MPPAASAVGGIVLLMIGLAAGLVLAPALVPGRVQTVSPAAAPPSAIAQPSEAAASAPRTFGPAVPRTPPIGPPVDSATDGPPETKPAEPVRFHSGRLRVDVPVHPIDASSGVLLPPGDPQQLGWWRGGAMPGSGRGRVLITGHTVQAGGGAFDDLARLRMGDVVDVTTATGRLHYRVALIQYLTIESFAERAPQLLRAAGPERLVLVTCDGWDGVEYQGSTVVIAEPVGGRRQ
jgi:LPXTG-site transpeptidase (sortase) family protein